MFILHVIFGAGAKRPTQMMKTERIHTAGRTKMEQDSRQYRPHHVQIWRFNDKTTKFSQDRFKMPQTGTARRMANGERFNPPDFGC